MSSTGKHQLLGGTSLPLARKKPRIRPIAKPQKRRVIPPKPDAPGATTTKTAKGTTPNSNTMKQLIGKDVAVTKPTSIAMDPSTSKSNVLAEKKTTTEKMGPPKVVSSKSPKAASSHPPKVARSIPRLTRPASNTKKTDKGSSITIGSSIKGRSDEPIFTPPPTSPSKNDGHDNTSITPSNNVDEDSIAPSTTSTDTAMISRPSENAAFIPYQHLGLIDPAWGIPQPKAGEKSMKDFCSKFKLSKEVRQAQAAKRRKERKDQQQQKSNTQTNENDGENNQSTEATTTTNNDNNVTTDLDNAEGENESEQSGPMVEIVNGEIVISQSSMIVGSRKTIEEVDREMEGRVVVEDSIGLTATYNSFVNREKILKWTNQETKQFYLALRQCGTDFTMMENYFDGSTNLLGGESGSSSIRKRSRKQLKGKYKVEIRKNPKLIDMALNPTKQLPLDLSVFSDMNLENYTRNAASSSANTNSTSQAETTSSSTHDVNENAAASTNPTNSTAPSTEESNTSTSRNISSSSTRNDLNISYESSPSLETSRNNTEKENPETPIDNQESSLPSAPISTTTTAHQPTIQTVGNKESNSTNVKNPDSSTVSKSTHNTASSQAKSKDPTDNDITPLALVPNAGKPKQKQKRPKFRPGGKSKSKTKRPQGKKK